MDERCLVKQNLETLSCSIFFLRKVYRMKGPPADATKMYQDALIRY